MVEALKTHGETLIKNWLEEEYAPGQLNLTKLRSVPLIKELIAYNRDGNFDRVMAFMLCMYAVQEKKRLVGDVSEKFVPIHKSDFFDSPKFKRFSLI
jgi:hypothetical protein